MAATTDDDKSRDDRCQSAVTMSLGGEDTVVRTAMLAMVAWTVTGGQQDAQPRRRRVAATRRDSSASAMVTDGEVDRKAHWLPVVPEARVYRQHRAKEA